MGLLSKRTHGDFICRMFQCLCTHFVTSACCIDYIACILRWRGCQAAFHCALQLVWMKSYAFDAFLYCTYLYILTILPCYKHRFCYICLFLFPTKIGPLRGIFFFFLYRKYACNFCLFASLVIIF